MSAVRLRGGFLEARASMGTREASVTGSAAMARGPAARSSSSTGTGRPGPGLLATFLLGLQLMANGTALRMAGREPR
jgi:hypothetical protein